MNIYYEPQGWPNSEFGNRMQTAINCAIQRWNGARGTDLSTSIPTPLERTDSLNSADIVVQRGLAEGGCGENTTGEARDIIDIDGGAFNLSDEELCLLVAHEIGHSLGLDNETSCYTIMGGTQPNGSCNSLPEARAIQPNDVDRVNQYYNSQNTCTAQSPSTVSRSSCVDRDGDGISTCNG
ncbi:MAG: hypothetical protein LC775_00245, partial [Acidobacteria bacterium]|nr:hypothetical protein [Acidobacteriota bacterium]